MDMWGGKDFSFCYGREGEDRFSESNGYSFYLFEEGRIFLFVMGGKGKIAFHNQMGN